MDTRHQNSAETPRNRQVLHDITNQGDRRHRHGVRCNESPSQGLKKKCTKFQGCWTTQIELKYLWFPLGSWTLDLNGENPELVPMFKHVCNWTILFIKDFSEAWRPGSRFEARLTPLEELDAVAQHLFLATPSMHSCIILEGIGFLWLNKLQEEPFVRCNWLEDPSASARILPPLNLCFDLDDTLIFNAPVRGAKVQPSFVVPEPPHLLVEDVDPNGEVCSSDSPYIRPQMCEFLELVTPFFRNIRIATFSVAARAKEIAEYLDGNHTTLLKNYRPDPITGQKPVAHVVFARELLLLQGHVLGAQERQLIKAGAVFWLKSLDMLDLPQKGLHQRTIILDDRLDVWAESNRENVVRITGPDRPGNIGDLEFLNGETGGEVGKRMLLSLINLELKSTRSSAYCPGLGNLPLAPKRHLAIPQASPKSVYVASPARLSAPRGQANTAVPQNKPPRSTLRTGFSHARERREHEVLQEKAVVTCP
eukprot:GGOE01015767.1.p1 GENE.GGOE01015767.1~~GGOE01015767.1.p1  ORF type:complete len:490 (-),score=20.90 GGOE01015767.1:206-1642(-)